MVNRINITVLCIAAVCIGFMFILAYLFSRHKSDKRFTKLHEGSARINNLLMASRKKHVDLMLKAGKEWGYWEYKLYCIAVAGTCFYICYKWFSIFMAVMMGTAALKLIRFYLNIKIKTRKNKLQSQFNNALEYIRNEYAACNNDRDALKRAYEYFKPPLEDEFANVIQAINLGVEYLPALKNMDRLWDIKRMQMFIGILSSINYHGSDKGLILLQGLINQAKKEEALKSEFKAKATVDIILLMVIIFIIPASLLFLRVFTPSLFDYYTNNIMGQIALSFVAVVELVILFTTYMYVVKEF